MKKRRGIFAKLMLLVVGVVLAALLVVSVFMRDYIEKREMEIVQQRIQSIAKIVSDASISKDTVATKTHNDEVVTFTNNIVETTKVDFVVIMDTNFIRYSHPTRSIIGGVFSNVEDARRTIEDGAHFSFEDGTLGAGVRYFDAIKDNTGNIIGVVCVGYRKVTVDQQIEQAQQHIFGALIYGLVIAIVLAYLFSVWLKYIMLGLEPEELSQLLVESVAVSNYVTEGIIALDDLHNILFINTSAKKLLSKLESQSTFEKGTRLNQTIEQLLFANSFETKEIQRNYRVIIDKLELVVGRSPIYIKGKFAGIVVTVQDQTDFVQLVTELSSTEQYNDALRSANHHHMNQIHVLNGLLELKQYDEAENFIDHLKRDYHESLGNISTVIKIPAIAGFLIGKQQELQQKNVILSLDSDSVVNNIDNDALIYDLTLILGVLIDNAVEASKEKQTIAVYINIDVDNNSIVCSVEDYGQGIGIEQQKYIFERGYSTKGSNRGYGLDAVMSIVKERNGKVDVDSQENFGTCITVEVEIEKIDKEDI